MGVDGKHRSLVGLAALAWLVCAGAASAQCRLALVLGLDISSSVDADEDALQRQGLARALIAPEVIRAALAIPGEPVALAVFEWSGRWQQDMILDWTLLNDEAKIRAASAVVAASSRSYADFPTAAGYALGYATEVFQTAPRCLFQTLDISGDGISNEGFPPVMAYREFPFDDITVNGLPITGHDEAVVTFYREQMIHGPGAFLQIADGFADFERAMRRKLEREMGVISLGAVE